MKRIVVNYSLSPDIIDKIKKLSEIKDKSMSAIVAEAIEHYFAEVTKE